MDRSLFSQAPEAAERAARRPADSPKQALSSSSTTSTIRTARNGVANFLTAIGVERRGCLHRKTDHRSIDAEHQNGGSQRVGQGCG